MAANPKNDSPEAVRRDDEDCRLGPLVRRIAATALRRLARRIERGGRGAERGFLELDAVERGVESGTMAAATRKAYAGALRRWLDGRPLTDALLAEHLRALSGEGRSSAVAAQVVAAVRCGSRHAADSGGSGLCPAGPESRRQLERHRREAAGREAKQAEGVGWEQADRMCALAAAGGDARGLRDAALVAVASDCLLRVSEVSALDVGDIAFKPCGSARLSVRRSKTDQAGVGAELYVGAAPAERVRRWLAVAGIASGPLFRGAGRGSTGGRLGPDSVRAAVKRRAAQAGIGGGVSGHSLRVGSAQSLAARGASLVDMQLAGRWRSPDLPARYARALAAERGAVARLRYGMEGKSERRVASPETGVVESG